MPMTREQLFAEARALDPREREALAEELLLSLDEADRATIDAAWLEEVKARDASYRRGESKAYPVDDVIAELRARAKR